EHEGGLSAAFAPGDLRDVGRLWRHGRRAAPAGSRRARAVAGFGTPLGGRLPDRDGAAGGVEEGGSRRGRSVARPAREVGPAGSPRGGARGRRGDGPERGAGGERRPPAYGAPAPGATAARRRE